MTAILEEFKKHSLHTIDSFKKEAAGVRTSRPSPALVENLKVSYYEQTLALKQFGSIAIAPPREIVIQIWDKSAVSNVVKAIEASNLGLSANVEGNVIKIYLPELSAERREELAKHVKRLAEQHRIQLRHFRDEANKKIHKSFDSREINEDQKFKLKEAIQKEIVRANDEIDKILENKIKEINE